ncbi:expressed unknown protein [Seminavis robusta]|uniref:Uncharacterized protein n=1 Tax=Seminavis robusta TaxID=568900 RepID=A0A9N8HL71_9STRA|nr:expressed unknown protein [Seminavis robusta]|eukprot:Sro788_g202480.1 n/a (264) ;mRNA; r:7163-7954
MASTVTTDNNSNNNNPQRNTDQARIRNTAIQAFYYVLAYSMTHTFVFLAANFDYFLPSGSPFLLTLLGVFSFPLQGILNVFIFLRPRIHVLQTRDSSLSYCRAVHWATFHYDDGRNRATDSVVLPTANNIKSSKRSLGSSSNTTSVLLQNSSKTGESSKFFVANNTTTAGVNQIPITVSSNSDEVSDEDDSMVLSEPPEAVATAIDIQQEDVRATEGDPRPSKLCHIKGGSKEGWVGAAGDGVKHGEDINDMSFLSEGSEREA